MPTLSDRIAAGLRNILRGIFSSLTRKLCVVVLDGNRVMRFDAATGGFIDQFITFDAGTYRAWGMGVGSDGHLLVPAASSVAGQVSPIGLQRFHGTTGSFIDTFAPWPLLAEHSSHDYPDCVTLGPDGYLYAGCGNFQPGGPGSIYRYNAKTGAFVDVFVPPRTGGLQCPGTLRFGPDGNLYVRNCSALSPAYGLNILRFNGQTGAFMDVFVPASPEPFNLFGGMAFGPDGHLYLSGWTAGVQRFDGTTGTLIDTFVPQAQCNVPAGLTFSGGDLYVANAASPYVKPTYGNVSRFDGHSGALVQVYQRLGADHIHPTDVVVTVADIPFPSFNVGPRDVPFWVTVIAGVVLGALVGRSVGPRSRR